MIRRGPSTFTIRDAAGREATFDGAEVEVVIGDHPSLADVHHALQAARTFTAEEGARLAEAFERRLDEVAAKAGRRELVLAVHPRDAEGFGLADGDIVGGCRVLVTRSIEPGPVGGKTVIGSRVFGPRHGDGPPVTVEYDLGDLDIPAMLRAPLAPTFRRGQTVAEAGARLQEHQAARRSAGWTDDRVDARRKIARAQEKRARRSAARLARRP